MFSKIIPVATKSDGTKVPYEPGKGYSLAIATYYVDVSLGDPAKLSVHVAWDAVIAGTAIYQDSNLPAFKSLSQPYTDNSASADVTNIDAASGATLGSFIPQNMTTGQITTTAGGSVATSVLTIAGGTAGGARFDVVSAARRARIQLIISTAGFIRVHAHGKQA